MKFKNKTSNVILETNNQFVIEQMSKSDIYEELKEEIKVPRKKSEKIEE